MQDGCQSFSSSGQEPALTNVRLVPAGNGTNPFVHGDSAGTQDLVTFHRTGVAGYETVQIVDGAH